MKAKYLFTTVALSALLVSCAKQEFAPVSAPDSEKGELIQVDENFRIAMSSSDVDGTKSSWNRYTDADGVHLRLFRFPVATSAGQNSEIAGVGVIAPELGVCLYEGGQEVKTNYLFIHDGWLRKPNPAVAAEAGLKSLEAKFSNCAPFAIQNGWLYSNILTVNPSPTTLNENVIPATASATLDGTAFLIDYTTEANYKEFTKNTVDLESGIFRTENLTLFGGDYIVYAPYNEDFVDKGAIEAKATHIFDNIVNGDDGLASPILANSTFTYGYAANLIGGKQASKFTMKNLNGLFSVQVYGLNDATKGYNLDANNTEKLEKIFLYSKNAEGKGCFVYQVNLDGSKIKAGNKGTELYVAGSEVYGSTIIANILSTNQAAIPVGPATGALKYYLSAFPTTLPSLEVILYREDKKIARIPIEDAAARTITAGGATVLKVPVEKESFKEGYFIVDETSLAAAIATGPGSATAPKVYEIVGDVTINSTQTIPSFVTIQGDNIIVGNNGVLTLSDNVECKSNIIVESEDCCNTAGAAGQVNMTDATISGTVTFNDRQSETTGLGSLTITAGAVADAIPTITGKISGQGEVNVGAVSSIGVIDLTDGEVAVNAAEGDDDDAIFTAEVKVPELTIGNANVVTFNENVTVTTLTSGTTNAQGAKVNFVKNLTVKDCNIFSSTIDGSTASFDCGGTFTLSGNAVVEGGAVVNFKDVVVSAKAKMTLMADDGTKQSLNQTKVNVSNGTFTNNGTVEIKYGTDKNSGDSEYDAELFIKSTGTFVNNGVMEVYGLFTVNGLAENALGGKVYDRVSANISGAEALELGWPGEYISDVDNNGQRYLQALSIKPTTTLRFVGDATAYDLAKIALYPQAANIEVYEVNCDAIATITFNSSSTDVLATMPKLVISQGSCLVSAENNNDATPDHLKKLTVTGDVIVKKGTKLDIINGVANTMAESANCVFSAGSVLVEAGGNFGLGDATTAKKPAYAETLTLFKTDVDLTTATPVYGNMVIQPNSVLQNKDIVLKGFCNIKSASGIGADMPAYVYFSGYCKSDDAVWGPNSGRPIKH